MVPTELITDIEAEQHILSAMMHSEQACITAGDTLTDDDFSEPFHQQLFTLITDLFQRQVKPTHVEILKELSSLQLLNKENNAQINTISQQYIDDGNISYWTSKARAASKARKTQQIINSAYRKVNTQSFDPDELLQDTHSKLFALAMDMDNDHIDTAEDIARIGKKKMRERMEKWRQYQEDAKAMGSIPLEGVPTGFAALDRLTLGYKPGDLIILGAETGHGKTAFALNTSKAVIEKHKMLYVNTEMSREQMAQRWGAMLSGVKADQIKTGSLNNAQADIIDHFYNTFAPAEFYLKSEPNLTPNRLEYLARKAHMQLGIDFMVVDYVGRMEKHRKGQEEWQVLEQIIKSQKILAQNLGIAVMCLVQLNPDGTLQGAKRMKNECDLMMKLVPVDDELRNDTQDIQAKNGKMYEPFNYRIYIDKARDGQSGVNIPLVFDKETQQIKEAEVIGRQVE